MDQALDTFDWSTQLATIGTAVSPGVELCHMWVMTSMTGVDRSGFLAASSFICVLSKLHVHNAG